MPDVNINGPDGNDSSFMQIQTLQVSVAVQSLPAHLHEVLRYISASPQATYGVKK